VLIAGREEGMIVMVESAAVGADKSGVQVPTREGFVAGGELGQIRGQPRPHFVSIAGATNFGSA
jgi:hypothetical protein